MPDDFSDHDTYTFQGIVFDDVVFRQYDGLRDQSQVCYWCVDTHRLASKEDARLSDISVKGLTCGIAGCTHEAEFYIDFADGALKPLEVQKNSPALQASQPPVEQSPASMSFEELLAHNTKEYYENQEQEHEEEHES